jgi:hypothetical protein
MDYGRFTDEEAREMNAVYQVTTHWPGYLLIGMDGGGRGYFCRRDGGVGIYFLGDMGNISEPKYLCEDEREIDSSIETLIDLEPVNEKVDVVVFVTKDKIGDIRRIQEAFECPVTGISELLSQVGTELVVVSNVYRSKVEVIFAQLGCAGIGVWKSTKKK